MDIVKFRWVSFNFRVRKTDGPLFRGRYKALLVDVDSYFLQVSKYIHRNPIDCRKTLVEKLGDFKWSSFPAFMNGSHSEHWLELGFTLRRFDNNSQAYSSFIVGSGGDEVKTILDKPRWPAILGSQMFIEQIKIKQENADVVDRINKLQGILPEIEDVVKKIAELFSVEVGSIIKARRGRGAENVPRWCAIYLSRELGSHQLNAIAAAFNMGHVSGVNLAISKLKSRIDVDPNLNDQLKPLTKILTP